MSDLISRQDAIRIAEQGQIQGYMWQFEQLVKLPSAEKTGKWTKETKHYKDQLQEFDYYTIKCSVCGSAPEKNWHLTHYCPNCGSRMLEEWEEE
jgi:DNA-directed RNA polymerase subunit RPC12/RpoP